MLKRGAMEALAVVVGVAVLITVSLIIVAIEHGKKSPPSRRGSPPSRSPSGGDFFPTCSGEDRCTDCLPALANRGSAPDRCVCLEGRCFPRCRNIMCQDPGQAGDEPTTRAELSTTPGGRQVAVMSLALPPDYYPAEKKDVAMWTTYWAPYVTADGKCPADWQPDTSVAFHDGMTSEMLYRCVPSS